MPFAGEPGKICTMLPITDKWLSRRPRLAMWIKWHWSLVRWLPFGGKLWNWADGRVEAWHSERAA